MIDGPMPFTPKERDLLRREPARSYSDTIAGDPARGHELAQLWCTTCHLIGPEQQRATDAVPTFASVARRPGTMPNHFARFCWCLIMELRATMQDLAANLAIGMGGRMEIHIPVVRHQLLNLLVV